jgi:glucosamine--fructose-6-phosphate aminotransferase (isomerizing)
MSAGAQMAAEMAQQPGVLGALAARREDLVARVRAVLPERPAGVALVARGSSDHAAVFGRYVLEQASGRPVALAAPSLSTLYGVRTDYRSWVVVAVSQSGRTPEIVTMLERMKAAGACTVAVTNEAGSPLAQAADALVELEAGEELAVPATKTFTAQVAAFAILAEALGPVPWDGAAWDRLPNAVEEILADGGAARAAAQRIGGARGMICVARGYLYCVALEAALKLKETTSILAEGYSAADFRHGPIAVVDRGLPVLTFAVAGPAQEDVERLAGEVRERGGQVLSVGDGDRVDLPAGGGIPEALATIPAAVRAQQLAWALALARGVDPDAPFALSKVTATE